MILRVIVALAAAWPSTLPAQAPVLELDHVYIVVPPGAAAAVHALRQVGVLVDTTTGRHDGEGATSIAAFFHNAYLELLWVDSTVAVDSAHQADVADFRRAADWAHSGASPFGLGLHFRTGGPADLRIPVRLDPVPGAHPPADYVLLRQPVESLAADLFIMPTERAVTSWLARYRTRHPDLFAHSLGVQRITRLVVRGPLAHRPSAANLDLRPIQFEEAAEPLLLVEFDGGRAGESFDLRPALPLILRR
jgi:hypothetical protein